MELNENTISQDDYLNYIGMVDKITIESMKAAANKYLDPNNYSKVILLPEE